MNVFDGFPGVAIRLLVAGYQVITGFPLQYLADGASADRGLDGILYVTDIDTVTSSRALRPVFSQAMAVEPEPPNGSKTNSPP